MQEETVTRNQ